jgi:hypothetical protein
MIKLHLNPEFIPSSQPIIISENHIPNLKTEDVSLPTVDQTPPTNCVEVTRDEHPSQVWVKVGNSINSI